MEQYHVTGMSCAACSARVEKAVAKVDGVTSCSVSLLTNSMGVEGTAEPAAIIAAVENAGYGASLKNTAKHSNTSVTDNNAMLKDKETPLLRKRLIASLCFLIPLMYLSMGHMMWNWPIPSFLDGNHIAMGLIELLFTTALSDYEKVREIEGIHIIGRIEKESIGCQLIMRSGDEYPLKAQGWNHMDKEE